MVNRKKYKFHHVGIPTKLQRDNEKYHPDLKFYHSGYETSEFGIEWMRFEKDCPLPEIVQKVAHVAFQVDDLEQVIRDKELLIEPNSPSAGVKVAFILEKGAPVELIQIDD